MSDLTIFISVTGVTFNHFPNCGLWHMSDLIIFISVTGVTYNHFPKCDICQI